MRNRAQKNFFLSEFEVLRTVNQLDGVLKIHDAFETERSLVFVTEPYLFLSVFQLVNVIVGFKYFYNPPPPQKKKKKKKKNPECFQGYTGISLSVRVFVCPPCFHLCKKVIVLVKGLAGDIKSHSVTALVLKVVTCIRMNDLNSFCQKLYLPTSRAQGKVGLALYHTILTFNILEKEAF